MTLGYRAILSTSPTRENFIGITEAFSQWVTKKKGFEEVLEEGSVSKPSGATLSVALFTADDGSITAKRWTLVEDWESPPWYSNSTTARTGITNVTLVSEPQALWLWVDVEPPTLVYSGRDGRLVEDVQQSGRPTFVKDILDSVHMRDGVAEPSSDFQIIATSGHVDELARVLVDDKRIGAAIVSAAPIGKGAEEWANYCAGLVGQIQGMGTGYVLTQEAQQVFNRTYGKAGHWISSGGMRTFIPGADLSDPQDSYNHRLLHSSTIENSDEKRVRRIIRNAQLKRLNAIRIPDVLREADYEFLRRERLKPFVRLHDGANLVDLSVSDESETWRSLAEAAERSQIETLEDVRQLRVLLSELKSERDQLQNDYDELYQNLIESDGEISKRESHIEYLQKQLVRVGPEGARASWSYTEQAAASVYPNTFAELLKMVSQLSGVEFTGEDEDVLELDEHPMLGATMVRKAWDSLVTFDAYSQVRIKGEFDQSFSQYLKSSVRGFKRIGRVIWTEGETVKTNEKYRAQRLLRVAPEVDPSETILMVAHVRLSNLTGVAPRMYFHDTYSKVGYVTVGYLGSHMDNTLSN